MVSGDRLLANFRTERDGWVRFELAPQPVWPPLPTDGIEGYRFEDMTPMNGDQSHVPVIWSGKGGLAALGRKPVAIRVRMHKATLYSVAMAGRQEERSVAPQAWEMTKHFPPSMSRENGRTTGKPPSSSAESTCISNP